MFQGKSEIEKVFMALSEQLKALGAGPLEMVVCGGAALNVLGFVRRTTKDVDIIGFIERNENNIPSLKKADKLIPALAEAAKKVGRDFNLPENWLNTGPASALDFGLPAGFMARLETRAYSSNL
jgi:hypothetical protein